MFHIHKSFPCLVSRHCSTRSSVRNYQNFVRRPPSQTLHPSSCQPLSTCSMGFGVKSGSFPQQQRHMTPISIHHSLTRCFAAHPRERTKERGSGIAVVGKRGSGTGYCYGCGADLVTGKQRGQMQTVEKRKGFWATKNQELHKAKIKNWALCPRCKTLQKQAKKGKIDLQALEGLAPDSKMTQVFREEVSKIRTKEKAVVVLCVDAVNISGSLIKTIRNYVGGNPILLAVTRCDLLPPYVWERHAEMDTLKTTFRRLASDIIPAEVYLCSEEADYRDKTGGLNELTDDLWQHLKGRDPYIIGAANIGKSTLTDILITKLASRGMKAGHFGDRMGKRRLEKIRESRITKSSLPGTTLQNVRVPCFEDHNQALWDTPGLLLDESTAHFPIRNLRAIRVQRPSQIEPQIHETDKKGFCLVICEKGDDLPLIRIEVRLKKDTKGLGPVRLVWNSTLNLETKIIDIPVAHEDEQKRWEKQEQEDNKRKEEDSKRVQERAHLTREERKREYEEKVARGKKELGHDEWRRQEKKRKREAENQKRLRILAKLTPVHEVVFERNVGMDLAIANFGWLGLLVPRTTLIRAYAPNSGVRVSHHPTLALPMEWGKYIEASPAGKDAGESRSKGSDAKVVEDSSVEFDEDDEYGWGDDDMDADDWDRFGGGYSDIYGSYDDEFDMYDDHAPLKHKNRFGFRGADDEGEDDIWAQYSGKHVGWQFDADTRFMKVERLEGWNPLRENED